MIFTAPPACARRWHWLPLLTALGASLCQADSGTVDYAVSDPKLQRCLDELARRHAWQRAAQFTEISCHNRDIGSLEGLERFTSLEKLSLHKNNIARFALPPLAKLRTLNLANNKLSELTLANMPALEKVYAFGNKLTRLTLTDLPQLKMIKANANAIVEFSYRNIDAVQKVYLFDNALEHIDIYHLPRLQYMDVRQNPMPDKLYEEMDALAGVTIQHDGNADDWD